MYTITKYDIQGNVLSQTHHNELIAAPAGLKEYADIIEQLNAEEWDLRDSTNPLESIRDRQDWVYA